MRLGGEQHTRPTKRCSGLGRPRFLFHWVFLTRCNRRWFNRVLYCSHRSWWEISMVLGALLHYAQCYFAWIWDLSKSCILSYLARSTRDISPVCLFSEGSSYRMAGKTFFWSGLRLIKPKGLRSSSPSLWGLGWWNKRDWKSLLFIGSGLDERQVFRLLARETCVVGCILPT